MGVVLSAYLDALTEAMATLAEHPQTLFVGQGVKYPGQRMHETFARVPDARRVEMPVVEDFQMGYCTGLALEGYIPVCVYPRMDFLVLALNQLVNHLDKIEQVSEFRPKVIVRVAVGARTPLDPGPQHRQDHTDALALMLKHTPVLRAYSDPVLCYRSAMEIPGPVVVVEYMENY
jgi:pyruvate/2-oxoglutarate/acetoin dehydrogenase E1 component